MRADVTFQFAPATPIATLVSFRLFDTCKVTFAQLAGRLTNLDRSGICLCQNEVFYHVRPCLCGGIIIAILLL